MSRELDLHVTRGTTLVSGKIFSVIESVPDDITYEELMGGITAGDYTLLPLTGKTYAGQVRDRAGASLRGSFTFSTTADMLVFSLAASVTATFPDDKQALFYNVLETTTATGVVKEIVRGKIFVRRSETEGV
jgi:hypothetical protein